MQNISIIIFPTNPQRRFLSKWNEKTTTDINQRLLMYPIEVTRLLTKKNTAITWIQLAKRLLHFSNSTSQKLKAY